jgi:hypothetical protein
MLFKRPFLAVSGFHKKIFFRAVGSYNNKSITLDDTCYFFPCYSKKQALFIEKLLNFKACLNLLEFLIFFDAKHPDYFEPYGTKKEKSLFKA